MESLLSAIIVLLLVTFSCFTSSEALSSNNGNITIKWDLMSWTPDGYVPPITKKTFNSFNGMENGMEMDQERSNLEHGWCTDHRQGDCSNFNENIPQSCVRKPTVVDLLPETPYNQQIANCYKGGVLKPGLDSAFQIAIGNAGNSVKTARMPVNFMFMGPKQQYICGPTKNVRPTRFITADKRRVTRAMMTWNITCVFHKAI